MIVDAMTRAPETIVRDAIERWVGSGCNLLPAREPPFDVEDGGVPPAMWAHEPDADGWVHWKALPSSVTAEDLARLESRIGAPLPPHVRAWLTAACIGPLEPLGGRLCALWSSAPLRDLEATIAAWSPLERAGFLPIGDADNDVGPLCVDLLGEERLVAFDHEVLLDLASEARADRARIETLAIPCGRSLAELLEAIASTQAD